MTRFYCQILTLLATIPLSSQKLELVIPTGHTRQVQDIVVDLDTTFVASIQNGNEIILWSYKDQSHERTLRYHTGRVNDLEIIEANLWSASDDGYIRAWDVAEGSIIAEIDIGTPVLGIKSFAAQIIAIAKNGTVRKLSSAGRFEDEEMELEDRVVGISNVLNGQLLVVLANKSIIQLDLNAWSQGQTFRVKSDVIALAISSGYFHVGTSDGELITYQENDGSEVDRKRIFDRRLYGLFPSGEKLYLSGRGSEGAVATVTLRSLEVLYPKLDLGDQKLLEESGVRAIAYGYDPNKVLIANANNQLVEFKKDANPPLKKFEGAAYQIEDFDISRNEELLAVASGQPGVQIYDLKRGRPLEILEGHTGGTSSVAFHPTDTMLASVGNDDKLKVWSIKTGSMLYSFDLKGRYANTHIQFDETGRYLIRKADQKYFELFKLDKSKSKKLTVDGGIDYHFAANGEKILFQTKSGFTIYNSVTLKEERSYPLAGIKDFDVSGERIIATGDFGLRLFNLSFSDLGQLKDNQGIDRIYLNPVSNTAIGTINSAKKGSSKRDYTLKLFDLKELKFHVDIPGHEGFVSKVDFLKNGTYTITSASDGKILLWKDMMSVKEPIGTVVPLTGENWVASTSNGLYDAGRFSFDMLHYVQGKRKMALDQLKDLYFEPRLIPRLLGNIEDPLPDRKKLGQLAPHPEMNIKHPNLNDGILGVNLEDNGGGVGRVVILINGKEVVRESGADQNTQGNIELQYKVQGHPFLKPNAVNKISIKAYNEEGSLSSPQENLFFLNSPSAESEVKPNLYALIVGSGDYPGQAMDLNYAVKDAVDFSEALKTSANNYFGEDKTNIKLFHTDYADTSNWPTKYNIHQSLKEFAVKANAQDYLLLYFSGHGMNYGQPEDFYYLTAMATDQIDLDENRLRHMVSSTELTSLIKQVAALKQVLIFDACHSGKLASQLGSDGISTGQVKAMETMKDRTGLYVIAGSESDAVSYETSLFQQGLLTYSLLFGMKGAALGSDGEVDIIDLMQFASKKVPELAEEIGGVQLPEVRMPAEAESFTIGKLSTDDRDKIALAGSKPVYIHSGFQEELRYVDQIKLGDLVDGLLIQESQKEKSQILFLDKKQFGSAFQIRGRYRLEGEVWRSHAKLFQDEKLIKESDFEAVNAQALSEKIAQWAIE